jgi:hypothetical protein
VATQGVAVLATLVAKHRTELFELCPIDNEPLPVVMPDLVTNVSEESPIGLVHADPTTLTFGIVCFSDIDGDHSCSVASEDARGTWFRRVGLELERQASLRILVAIPHGKAEAHQCEHEATLRGFDPVPGGAIFRAGEIRDDARQAA